MSYIDRASSLTIIAITAAVTLLVPALVSAQDVALEGDWLALTYTKALGVDVTTEKSADLISWMPVETQDKLIAKATGTETIKSSVAIGGADRLFLRLQASDGWKTTVTWDPLTQFVIAGYRLHYGTASQAYTRHLDVGPATITTVSLAPTEGVYFFVVTAYTAAGLESLPSKEMKVTRKGWSDSGTGAQ
jgi:hypothetical protein